MKTFFAVVVSLLVILLVANLIAFIMPVLVSPVVFTIWFGLLLIIVYKLIVRSAR